MKTSIGATFLAWTLMLAACSNAQAAQSPLTNNRSSSETSSVLPTQGVSPCTAYMTFAVNVHDTGHVDESADTVLRLISLFEKYHLRGDFYLTAPIVELYVATRPDVIERLRESDMTISYHIRPPHPLDTGFDRRLKGLDDQTLEATLRDYETYRLDPATGNLDKSRPGGFSLVVQAIGRSPVVASPMTSDPRLREAALRNFATLGAKMVVQYHEEGTDPDQPLVQFMGLWVRPSDFSITRVQMGNGKENFWWNLLGSSHSAEYDPTTMLQAQLLNWQGSRPPFVTSLIHENNFARSGPESWKSIYYDRERPLAPPFDLNAADPSRLRSKGEQEGIWKAYEEMVAFASKNLCIVTSDDIVKMAEMFFKLQQRNSPPPPPAQSSSGIGSSYTVTNPTSGLPLYVEVRNPRNRDQQSKLPALVLVPGGSGDSRSFTHEPSAAQKIADAGFAVIVFDPDGRGKSRGTEDYDGYVQQDGLAAVLRFAANLPEVNGRQIGLVSYSYGITMASGALARYPDLPVRFLIDWEGPADRNDTGGCDQTRTGHLQGVASCSDREFWSQREALTFVERVRVPYQRIQSERDHAQPDVTHALSMVNAAVRGGVPWVRLNDLPSNQTYDVQAPPKMASEPITKDRESLIIHYARELLQQ